MSIIQQFNVWLLYCINLYRELHIAGVKTPRRFANNINRLYTSSVLYTSV